MKQPANNKKVRLNLLLSSTTLENEVREKFCFTIIPTNSGFTDQMMQFSAFYKLGRALGLHYFHTPFKAPRSGALHPKKTGSLIKQEPLDIYNYLGFNHYMLEHSKDDSWSHTKKVDINFGEYFSAYNRVTFAEIIYYAQETINKAYKQSEGQKILLCFRLGAYSRAFFSVIHSHQPHFPDNLNLQKAFLQQNKKKLQAPVFNKTGIKILLHIRQGDTAVLETPWKTYIPVYGGRPGCLQEHQTLSAIDSTKNKDVGPIFSIDEYDSFISRFMEEMNLTSDSIKLFSDGFHRALDKVFSNPDLLNLTEEKIEALKEISENYDKNKFRRFSDTHKIECFIGERDEYLHHLIRSALETDIVIMGYQQRMLPKFLANYRLDNMPLVIVLHKGDLPDYSEVAHDWEDSFVFIDIRKPDYNLLKLRLGSIYGNTRMIRNVS